VLKTHIVATLIKKDSNLFITKTSVQLVKYIPCGIIQKNQEKEWLNPFGGNNKHKKEDLTLEKTTKYIIRHSSGTHQIKILIGPLKRVTPGADEYSSPQEISFNVVSVDNDMC